jgi:pimeloyl-ACP methyl ester carboxylesterase
MAQSIPVISPPALDAVRPVAPHSPLIAQARGRTVRAPDGVPIFYEVLGLDRPDAPTFVLANGLGGRLYAWEPLVERFAATHRIVTWDYRGLFRSGSPRRTKHLSIQHHAQDIIAVLDAEKIDRAIFTGWSMGVQVTLEAALEFPLRVERMVLLNGSYGHILETGLQPVMRLPGAHRFLHAVTERLVASQRIEAIVGKLLTSELHVVPVGLAIGWLWGNPRLKDLYRQYVTDVFGPSFGNYLRLFQALDAHSVYHLLPEVTQPALVVSGLLDYLTPATMSFEIARRLPRAEHIHFRGGSHFALLERSQQILDAIERFLAKPV